MVLGAVLHHDGRPCDGGGLGGSDKATKIDRNEKRSFDLSLWEHLGAPEGQFGAAYKGSLINLGIFKVDDPRVKDEIEVGATELDQETQDIDVRELSDLGSRLNICFCARNFAQIQHIDVACLYETKFCCTSHAGRGLVNVRIVGFGREPQDSICVRLKIVRNKDGFGLKPSPWPAFSYLCSVFGQYFFDRMQKCNEPPSPTRVGHSHTVAPAE
jgi:hypothetical protein